MPKRLKDPCEMTRAEAQAEYDRITNDARLFRRYEMRAEACLDRIRILRDDEAFTLDEIKKTSRLLYKIDEMFDADQGARLKRGILRTTPFQPEAAYEAVGLPDLHPDLHDELMGPAPGTIPSGGLGI